MADDPPPKDDRLPPLPSTQSFDMANQVAREAAEQRRRHPAPHVSSGTFDVAFGGAQPDASVAIGVAGNVSVSSRASVRPEAPAPVVPIAVAREVSNLLSKMRIHERGLRNWIDNLRSRISNDVERQAQELSLIEFLEQLATDLASVADEIQQAIDNGSQDSLEPFFLGKAAILARDLSEKAEQWMEEKGTAIVNVPINLGLFGGTLLTLAHFGIAGDAVAAAVAGIIVGHELKQK